MRTISLNRFRFIHFTSGCCGRMAEAKYQKLASEYAKLKAQIPVLKKAYLDEQSVSKDLKDQLKERELSVRKFEQEVDSLSFRNQQLSKRVLLLQDELEEAESSKKKNKPTSPGVYSEELQSKIMENEMLHKQVDESNRTYQSRIQELEQKLYHYEKETSSHQEALATTVKLQTLEADVKSYRSRAEKAHKDLNGLNLPTHDRKHQLRARELVGQSSNLLSEMVQALSNFYTYSEQRSKIYPADGINDPLSPVNVQYCKYLHENMTYLRPVEQSMKTFLNTLNEDSLTTLETATDLQTFAHYFKRLVNYMNKLLPYQLSSIEEECAISSCTSTLEAKNMELHKSFKCLTSVFNKLQSYVGLLASQSTKTCTHPNNVSKHYNSKVSLEHQLPTATQKLKTTDECIFSAFMSGNLDFFNQTPGYKTRGSSIGTDPTVDGPRSNPATVYFRQKAAQFVSSLAAPCPESVPHKLAVQHRKTLLSSAESKEGLSKQLITSQQRVNKLEQEKEHWMLELQLLQIKFDNETQKTKKLEKEIKALATPEDANSIQQNMTVIPDRTIQPTTTKTTTTAPPSVNSSLLGTLEHTVGGSTNRDTREVLIKNHFTNRINELTLEKQVAESKAVSFHSEVRALHKQLHIAEKVKASAEEEQKEIMMSEHLAGMNEKLAQQKDEIDELKSHQHVSSSKGLKKFSRK
ncbi:hypothetical protein KUTeg_013399 [Tegillarca granosa]|uniref:Protein phosphatase 1 regulatory subunit 21 n=1 Tax=Tegillarca granosa TaxID=220873 RepID=A0ABQ9ETN9_TEGGR|nr:hypothetical protein KUTeg_013399 [Tegillarca granosa]